MNHIDAALVIIVLSLSAIGVAIFRWKPKALEGNEKFVFRWKFILIVSLLLLVVGILLLFLPPELWWPGQ